MNDWTPHVLRDLAAGYDILTGEGDATGPDRAKAPDDGRSAHPAAPSPVEQLGNDSARRVAIWHATAAVADDLLRGDDLRPHYDEHERLSRLFQAVGDVTTDILDNSCLDLDAALVRLVAAGQLWLEARAREAAQ